jgi:cardiolipin synthase
VVGQHSISIRIYIWEDDATGTLIADQLFKAIQKNVAVFVIADGYASQCLSKEFIKHLRNQRIHFRYFEQLLLWKFKQINASKQ